MTVEKPGNSVFISPNLAKGETLEITLALETNFDGILALINAKRQIISSASIALGKGVQVLQQPFGFIPSCIYRIRISNGQKYWTMRFSKE